MKKKLNRFASDIIGWSLVLLDGIWPHYVSFRLLNLSFSCRVMLVRDDNDDDDGSDSMITFLFQI